jgi:3,4-dihydroxy 2-butanone 4-phosphate synthase/GTP cyclohydrolase II
VRGTIREDQEVLVRVHEPVSVLDFLDPDEGGHSWSMAKALSTIARAETGVVVLLNCSETSDVVLERFEAPAAVDPAAEARAARMDLRTYGIGAQILRDLGVRTMKLLARPRKMPSMAGFGLQITGYLDV